MRTSKAERSSFSLVTIEVQSHAPNLDTLEADLARWKPGPENAAIPPRQSRCLVTDLSGEWAWSQSHDFTAALLVRQAPRTYRVHLVAGVSAVRWTLERTATYQDGELLLDRPVRDALFIYQRLFTILRSSPVDEQVYLVADRAVHYSQALEQHYRKANPVPDNSEQMRDPLWCLSQLALQGYDHPQKVVRRHPQRA